MGVVEVTSEDGFGKASKEGLPLCCVFFWAAWHEPSQPGGQMDQVFTQLAEVHQGSVSFIKVEAEAVPEVSEKMEIAMVPTFVLLKGGAISGKVEGADPATLAKRIQEFANERVPEKGPGGADGATGLSSELQSKLKSLISASPVMLFMKGSGKEPKCKFSRKIVEILKGGGVEFGSFDILRDEDVRAGLKIYSNCSTFPQLYVRGVLVGGVDETEKLAGSGNLKTQLASIGGVAAVAAPAASAPGNEKTVTARCKELIASAKTMVFIKGTPDAPRCGFSRSIVSILREEGIDFSSFDILEDPDVRQTLKELSNWPTYPQLYVKGELVGGLDIIKEMKGDGPLASQLGITTKESLDTQLKSLLTSNKIMLFMKGSPDAPKCGFSRTAVGILREENVEFGSFDILEDDQVRQGLKKFSNWPTYPQLYADGELLGGLDIMKEMKEAGELAAALRPQA